MARTTTTQSSTIAFGPWRTEEVSPRPAIFSHDAYPPIANFKTIDGLLKSHAAEPDQKPLICYPATGVDDFEEHSAVAIDHYTDRAVDFFKRHGLKPVDPASTTAPIVSLLVHGSFEQVLTIFALNRLGYAILFLSTRLTASAYVRLMDLVGSTSIVHTSNFDSMVDEISSERAGTTRFPALPRKAWKYNETSAAAQHPANGSEWHAAQSGKIAWILHSSGSTGFPKPIYLTNLQCLANFRKSFGLRAFTASPLFHSGGLMELGRAFYARATMYLGNHSLPVTSTNMVQAIRTAKPKLVIAVPYVLKLLAEKQAGIDALASADIVLFNGSGCPDDLGDRLVEAGVNLVANYGATETGQLMTSYRGIPPTDREWSYLRLWRPVADHTLMDEIAPGVFEAVGLDGLPSKGPSNAKPPFSATNPENSFRTADLFTRHPDPRKSNFYKYLSRLDDRITLVMGEKVLPLPMEGRIRQEEIVREAVVFGVQQSTPGVLIFRPSDKVQNMSDADYLETVWPAVKAANARAESFSRIMKELVVLVGADRDYPKTDKGTFIRAQVYQKFDAEIKAAYANLENLAANSNKLELSVPELEEWLLARLRDDLHAPLTDANSDIFAAGVDSLQTTRMSKMIRQHIELGEAGSSMSTNVVFECGTVHRLAKYLYALRTGEEISLGDGEVETMQELIDQYSKFQQPEPAHADIAEPQKQTVMLTGATGNLGAFILHELVNREDVAEVIVLNRAADDRQAMDRTIASLQARRIQVSDDARSRVRALACDLSSPSLGLESKVIEGMRSKVTLVIHSAWAVNFNLGVRSFEQQHIKGTHNLVNFCLSSRLAQKPGFFFCSSVSTASSTPKPALIPERTIPELSHAQKTGYGRSKLVSERITANAMRSTGLHSRVLRIGQLGGDTKTGLWNETEAVALMFRSALATGALPDLDEKLSWLPVDVCARVIADLSLASSPHQLDPNQDADLVYHILNPVTFSFRKALLPYLRKLVAEGRYTPFEAVPPQVWLEKLEASEQDPEKNPSTKLLDFWKGKYGQAATLAARDDDDDAPGLVFETERTVQDCAVLGSIRDPVTEGLIGKYVDSWMASWKAGPSAKPT